MATKTDNKINIDELAKRVEERSRNVARTTEKYNRKKEKKARCGGDESKTLYSVTFNYKSKQISGNKFFPVTYRNFNRKLGELTENLKVGDIVRYEPRKQNKNFGLEAKILEITNYDTKNNTNNNTNKNIYKISFLKPLLGSSKSLDGILQYEEYNDENGNKKRWKNLIKVNKIQLYFCEKSNKEDIDDIIKTHLKSLVNFTFLRHKYPVKIQKVNDIKSTISFWIPEKSMPNEKRLISLNNNTSVIVKIPKKFKTNEYITVDIDPKLNSEFYSKETKKEIEQKINPIRFIPSYIFSENANKINTKIDRKQLIKTPKEQLYTVSTAKIVRNLGQKYSIINSEPGYKDIIVNVELTLNLKTLRKKDNTTNKINTLFPNIASIKNKFHDYVMNSSVCSLAKAKVGEGIEYATTPILITESQKLAENKAKERKRRNEMLRDPALMRRMSEFGDEVKDKADELSNKRSKRRKSIMGGKRKKSKKKLKKQKGSGKYTRTKYFKKQISLKKKKIRKIKKNLDLNPEENSKKKAEIEKLKRDIKNKTRRMTKRGGKRTRKK